MELIIKQHYVYALIDPQTNQPFYVGKGQGDRMYRHIWLINSESKKKRTNPIRNKHIREILATGQQPLFEREYFDTEEQAFAHEKHLIEHYGMIVNGTGILTNMQPGGFGPQVHNRKRVYQFTEEGTLLNTYVSAEAAASAVGTGGSSIRAACNPNIKQGVRIKGHLWSYEPTPPQLQNKKERKVNQYTLEGTFIKTFSSVRKAASTVNVNASGIVDVCKGYSRTCCGFVWAYEDNQPNIDKTLVYNNKKRCVHQYSLEGTFLNTFQSLTEASQKIGVGVDTIMLSCQGMTRKPRKFLFKYGDVR